MDDADGGLPKAEAAPNADVWLVAPNGLATGTPNAEGPPKADAPNGEVVEDDPFDVVDWKGDALLPNAETPKAEGVLPNAEAPKAVVVEADDSGWMLADGRGVPKDGLPKAVDPDTGDEVDAGEPKAGEPNALDPNAGCPDGLPRPPKVGNLTPPNADFDVAAGAEKGLGDAGVAGVADCTAFGPDTGAGVTGTSEAAEMSSALTIPSYALTPSASTL